MDEIQFYETTCIPNIGFELFSFKTTTKPLQSH
jgi:hypothetical protein